MKKIDAYIPTLLAELDPKGVIKHSLTGSLVVDVRVWCPYCVTWHYHGYDTGNKKEHRVTHCSNLRIRGQYTDADSPFRETGYYLKLDPRIKKDMAKKKNLSPDNYNVEES